MNEKLFEKIGRLQVALEESQQNYAMLISAIVAVKEGRNQLDNLVVDSDTGYFELRPDSSTQTAEDSDDGREKKDDEES